MDDFASTGMCSIYLTASSYPESAKAVSRAIGFDLGDPRSPLNKVSSSAVDNIKKELTEIGFFEWGLKK